MLPVLLVVVDLLLLVGAPAIIRRARMTAGIVIGTMIATAVVTVTALAALIIGTFNPNSCLFAEANIFGQ